MNILQLCKKFPYPPKDGETIAVLSLTKAFHQLGHRVTVLSINTPKHHFKIQQLPENIKEIADFEAVDVDTTVKPIPALRNIFTQNSYNIDRFYDQRFADAIEKKLKEQHFDIVQLEGLYLTPYIPHIKKGTDAPIVLRSHNIEFNIWERMAANTPGGLKKWYIDLLAKRLKKYELEHMNDYDAIIPIAVTDEDRYKELGAKVPVWTVEAGLDMNNYPISKKVTFDSIFFIGGLDWMPNQEGLKWFLEEVWPMVHKKHPDLKFFIAGRNAPDWLSKQKQPNVIFVGEVGSAMDFMDEKGIMIAPILSGSGIKIKVLEALAMAKPVVATSVAIEGIPVSDNEHLFKVDNAEEFAEAISKMVTDTSLATRLGKNGSDMVRERFDHLKLASTLIDLYKNSLL